jgi:hypothetical protein
VTTSVCPPSDTLCGGDCYSLQTSNGNCGNCGKAVGLPLWDASISPLTPSTPKLTTPLNGTPLTPPPTVRPRHNLPIRYLHTPPRHLLQPYRLQRQRRLRPARPLLLAPYAWKTAVEKFVGRLRRPVRIRVLGLGAGCLGGEIMGGRSLRGHRINAILMGTMCERGFGGFGWGCFLCFLNGSLFFEV